MLLAEETRLAFLASLRGAITAAAEQELAGSGWTTEHCPYIEYWFAYYERRGAGDIEAALRRYAPGATVAAVPSDYLPFVADRVRLAIRRWRATGQVDAPSMPTVEQSPAVIETRFPDAQPLPSDVRTRMEHALGQDLGDVRVHTGGDGPARAGASSARAVAVGQTIAFGDRQFAPHSMVGELLLAHELAHTLQQSRTSDAPSTGTGDEREADRLAAVTVARSRGIETTRPAAPLRRGLSLRRCNNFQPSKDTETKAQAQYMARERDELDAKATKAAQAKTTATVSDPDPSVLDPKMFRPNDDDDLVIAYAGGEYVALPASDLVYELLIKPEEIPAGNIFGVPTVGKEALRLVSVGKGQGILLDSGGRPTLLVPKALRLIKSALGVSEIVGINTLHIHDDHIRNLEAFIEKEKIGPERLRFPKEFMTSGKRFQRIINALRTTTKPNLVKLGFGKGAATQFTTWEVGTSPVFESYTVGDKLFEEYGIPDAFKTVARGRASGKVEDEASTFVRITDKPSGVKILVIGDPRGEALTKLRTELGAAKFGEIFEGVTVISGIQHHTGVLKDAKDRAGLERLLIELLSRNGELTVVEQSKITFHGGKGPNAPYMNASLVEALRQLGITHKAGIEPDKKTLGTITVDRDTAVDAVGGSIQQSLGDPEIAARFLRYVELDRAAKALRANESILTSQSGKPVNNTIVELEIARDKLGRSLGLLPDTTGTYNGLIQTVLAGVGTGTDHARPALTNQAAATQRAAAAKNKHASESLIEDPNLVELVEMLRAQGPLLQRATRHMKTMRRTGRVTDRLIRDLIMLNPQLARELLMNSPMNPASRDLFQTEIDAASLAGAKVTYPKVAGAMVALQVWNDIIGPAWALRRQDRENELNKYLNIILWWQERGVAPGVDAAANFYFDRDTRSQDPHVVSEMVRQRHADFLVLTKIEGEYNWDRFNLWMGAHVKNVDDFQKLVREKPDRWCAALRYNEKQDIWEYRAGDLSADTVESYTVTEKWLTDPRLDLIMKATIQRIETTTQTQLQDAWSNRVKPVEAEQEKMNDSMRYHPQEMLKGRVPQRRVKFKAGAEQRAYSVGEQSAVIGHLDAVMPNEWTDPTFYVFDASADKLNEESIGAGWLLVTGADYATYRVLVSAPRLRYEWEGQKVKRKTPGNDTGFVLVKKDAVEDF